MQAPYPYASFDIRQPEPCRQLAQHHASATRDDALTPAQVETGLSALVQFLEPQPWMVWRHGSFIVPSGRRSMLSLDTGAAAQLGLDLAAVATCKGFWDLLSGFTNPAQFEDAMFEVTAARWFVERESVESLQFSPEYEVRGHLKRPDFELTTTSGSIVCECKQLHLHRGDLVERLNKVTAAFDSAITALGVTQSVRVEVEVIGRVVGSLERLALQACTELAALPMLERVQFGPFALVKSELGKSPAMSDSWKVQAARVRLQGSPVGITPEYAYLLVSSPHMEVAINRAMGGLMREALKQLPPERVGLVIVAGNSHHGRLAAHARMSDAAYGQCLAIAVRYGGGFEFIHRECDRSALEALVVERRGPLK